MEEGGGEERWKRERGRRDGRGRGRERWKREGGGRDGRGRGEGEMGGLVIARVHCWCWLSFMRVRFRARAVAVRVRSMYVGRLRSSMGGSVCHLWAVVVVHGGVVFISVGAVAVIFGQSWLSACVRSWSWSFVGARGCVWWS